MTWHVNSNGEYRTHSQNLVGSRQITKHFLRRSVSVREKAPLLKSQKSEQEKTWDIKPPLIEESPLCHVPFTQQWQNFKKDLSIHSRTSSHYGIVHFSVFFSSKQCFNKPLFLVLITLCRAFLQSSYKCFGTEHYVWVVEIVYSCNCTLPWTHVPQIPLYCGISHYWFPFLSFQCFFFFPLKERNSTQQYKL